MQYNIPILLIIFNRPDLTQNIFNVIKKIKPKFLYIAADSARDNNEDDEINCLKTREIFDKIDWDCKIYKKYSLTNLGCDTSVRTALDWFFGKVEYGIVLEDDCLPNISFFHFCKENLEKYKNDNSVALICGTNHYDRIISTQYDYFYSDIIYTWGWASWNRIINKIEWNSFISIDESEKLLNEHYPNKEFTNFYLNIIKYFINQPKEKQPWDIDFIIYILTHKLKTIVPSRNMIRNNGYQGVHYNTSKDNLLFLTPIYEYNKSYNFYGGKTLTIIDKKRLMNSLITKVQSHSIRDKLYLIKMKIKTFFRI